MEAGELIKQVAAVLTVKGRIAAANDQITSAHSGYSLRAGRCAQIAPTIGGSRSHLIHGSYGPPKTTPKWHLGSVQPFLHSSRFYRQIDTQTTELC